MKDQRILRGLMFLVLSLATGCSPQLMRLSALEEQPVGAPDFTYFYGPDSTQFGDLRLPEGEGPFPIVAIIHGGCWLSAFDLHLMDAMATDLTQRGYATWNLEYRRVGDAGGGWPGTFLDIADGLDFLRKLKEKHPLDLNQMVVIGHSAGGHLALWAGSRSSLPAKSPIYRPDPLVPSGIISLAGIVDLEDYLVRDDGSCGSNVDDLLGGWPEAFPERYRQTSPVYLPVTGVARTLITGKKDPIVPARHGSRYRDAHPDPDGMIEEIKIGGIGHFELIAPGSKSWPVFLASLQERQVTVVPPRDRKKKKVGG